LPPASKLAAFRSATNFPAEKDDRRHAYTCRAVALCEGGSLKSYVRNPAFTRFPDLAFGICHSFVICAFVISYSIRWIEAEPKPARNPATAANEWLAVAQKRIKSGSKANRTRIDPEPSPDQK
jgi:hypothetical protein